MTEFERAQKHREYRYCDDATCLCMEHWPDCAVCGAKAGDQHDEESHLNQRAAEPEQMSDGY